jgi:hypothetical protein
MITSWKKCVYQTSKKINKTIIQLTTNLKIPTEHIEPLSIMWFLQWFIPLGFLKKKKKRKEKERDWSWLLFSNMGLFIVFTLNESPNIFDENQK